MYGHRCAGTWPEIITTALLQKLGLRQVSKDAQVPAHDVCTLQVQGCLPEHTVTSMWVNKRSRSWVHHSPDCWRMLSQRYNLERGWRTVALGLPRFHVHCCKPACCL